MEQSNTPDNVKAVELFAWLGEDELGSGEVGIKQAKCPAGYIPLVSVNGKKMDQDYMIQQLQLQANLYGKTIRLCKYKFVEEVVTILPELSK